MFNLRKVRGQTLAEKVIIQGVLVVVFVVAVVLIAIGIDLVIDNLAIATAITLIVLAPIGYFTWKTGMRAAQAKAAELDAQVKK
jgi:hypothetical protein